VSYSLQKSRKTVDSPERKDSAQGGGKLKGLGEKKLSPSPPSGGDFAHRKEKQKKGSNAIPYDSRKKKRGIVLIRRSGKRRSGALFALNRWGMSSSCAIERGRGEEEMELGKGRGGSKAKKMQLELKGPVY